MGTVPDAPIDDMQLKPSETATAAPTHATSCEELALDQSTAVPAEPPSKGQAELKEDLLSAKMRAVALKREGRIAEAKAALAEVKRLQALINA
jgi:hypothetical protein